MNAKTRFVLGGIGGLAPILLFLINLDFERYVAEATNWKTAGYVIRAVLLFLLGGFVAYLHDTEKKRITLFLVGISAPSLIAGYLSTATPAAAPTAATSGAAKAHALVFFVPAAQAQSPATEVKRFTLPPQSARAEFLDGLLGRQPANVWFVIAGSNLDLATARKQADTFNERLQAYHADVYAPYADNPYYAIVIAAYLNQEDARRFRDKAVQDGFPRDTYYKSFRGLPSGR